ncbi:hypothetical protein ICJ04_10540 [Stenotrophomonas sp. 169]|uniref:hypothetical protein n=1 Tax=Stenotrophomonas sp. 169 TaxID=2770322 RepID=UPI00166254CC|nr:hypothetical protein [Stenotrophomonas sp. 169]QNR96004.1 hypothetical protein ICJ04_10540 [Stenotrophomonas sp. 169]
MSQPMPVAVGEGYFLRFPVQDILHALVLKQAALLHYLHASIVLCGSGLIVAQGAMQRMADEAADDVSFLSLGVLRGITKRHEDFLSAFWADYMEDPAATTGPPKPNQVRREKILAALHDGSENPSRMSDIAKQLHKTYSGFIHASSANVMDLFDAYECTFRVDGGPDYLLESYAEDLWNYVYRGGLAYIAAAKAFHSDALVLRLEASIIKFQDDCGRDGDYGDKAQQ